MDMTPEDIHFIKTIGGMIPGLVAILIVHTLLYGIFFLLFSISTVIFVRRGLATRAQWTMFIISIICFALFSTYWTVNVMDLITLVKSVLVDNIALPNVENIRLYTIKVRGLDTMGEVIGELLPIISDAIVVWRAWAIFPSQRRWVIGPIIFLVCTIGLTIIHLLSFYKRIPALVNNAPVINGLFAAVAAASITTNLTATLLISYNLWDHRKHVSGNLGHQKSRSQGESVLAVLVESGAVYCVLQAVTIALQITYSHKRPAINYACNIYSVVYIGASAMYPVIVVVLVRLQLSFEHTYGFSLDSKAQEHEHKNTLHLPTIGQLQFASAPSNSIMNKEDGDILEETCREKESNV